MGHRRVDITFKVYRHFMPGSIGGAAMVLNVDLASWHETGLVTHALAKGCMTGLPFTSALFWTEDSL
ncbi:hypothetical protein [Streptomyces sp. NPDC005953]|uniref:hypothetical protein n=1 Tax=Streptomyces sp. NPDC005953 TaxID=3156719 RepID=UPI003400F6E6